MLQRALPRFLATRDSATWVAHGVLLIALAIVFFTLREVSPFRLDDALIYARYVRNLHEGHGLVFNVGEAHNGVTSPLYVWLLALVSLPFDDVAQVSVYLGGAALLTTVLLVGRYVFSSEQSPLVGAIAGLLLAITPLNYSTLGMESPVVVLVATGLLIAYRLRSWLWLGVLAGLMGLARSECIFLVAPLFLASWWRDRQLPWRSVLVAVAVMAPAFAYNVIAFGSPLPDTLTAKIEQGRSGFWGEQWVFLSGADDILNIYHVGRRQPLLLALLGLPAPLRRRPLFPAPLLYILLLGLVGFYSAFAVPAYHWYLVPMFWA